MSRIQLNRLVVVVGGVLAALRVAFPPKVIIQNGTRTPASAINDAATFARYATVDIGVLALQLLVILFLTAIAWWLTRPPSGITNARPSGSASTSATEGRPSSNLGSDEVRTYARSESRSRLPQWAVVAIGMASVIGFSALAGVARALFPGTGPVIGSPYFALLYLAGGVWVTWTLAPRAKVRQAAFTFFGWVFVLAFLFAVSNALGR